MTSRWPQPFPVRIHQHHRRHDPWRLSVNRSAQILKYVRQRSSAGYHLQQSSFRCQERFGTLPVLYRCGRFHGFGRSFGLGKAATKPRLSASDALCQKRRMLPLSMMIRGRPFELLGILHLILTCFSRRSLKSRFARGDPLERIVGLSSKCYGNLFPQLGFSVSNVGGGGVPIGIRLGTLIFRSVG